MDDVVAHINGDDEESINGDGTESNSTGDVCWMDDVGHKEDENGVQMEGQVEMLSSLTRLLKIISHQ